MIGALRDEIPHQCEKYKNGELKRRLSIDDYRQSKPMAGEILIQIQYTCSARSTERDQNGLLKYYEEKS